MFDERIQSLPFDKSYDADVVFTKLSAAKVEAVISAKSNRTTPIPHDRANCQWHNLDLLFSKVGSWHRIFARYDELNGSDLDFSPPLQARFEDSFCFPRLTGALSLDLARRSNASTLADVVRKEPFVTKSSCHVASLIDGAVIYHGPLGSIHGISKAQFPILERLSIRRIVLEPGVIREPHWHINANELAYCVSGDVLVSILDNADNFSSFTIAAGEMFHIDSGSLHHIENIGQHRAEIINAFSSENAQEFSLYSAFGEMSDAVLGNAYGLPAGNFATLPRGGPTPKLVKRNGPAIIPDRAGFANPHKLDLSAQSATLSYRFGAVKTARAQYWPALKNLSMYALRIDDDGMREPHWHPITAEMGYVHKGHARMTILDPNGGCDTYELKRGDCYFIPRAYPHQIEVIGTDDIEFLIFFDQPTPGDIGYRASATAFSRSVLAATFGVSEADLPRFPSTPIDPLIVNRVNPVDPV